MATVIPVTPFSMSFVMKATFRHMRRSLDISINKSIKRLQDFEGDNSKGIEIMETVKVLQTVREMLDDFEAHNPKIFS